MEFERFSQQIFEKYSISNIH